MLARGPLSVLAIAYAHLVNANPFLIVNVSPRATACARNYTVISGDICDQISATQNVSTFQLASVNSNINAGCTNLFAGEVLCLGLQGQDCQTVHVVVPGDSCFTIAGNAGITVATLQLNNPNVDANCTNIYPNEVLCTAAQPVYP